MEKKYTCPHCGKVIKDNKESWEHKYNNPILICPNCQNEFLRENCKEIAISKVSFDDKLPISLWMLILFLLGIFLLIGTVFPLTGPLRVFHPKRLIFGIILIVAGLIGSADGIKNFKKKRQYLAEEKKRSEMRCANTEYTAKLDALGYNKKK